eukprot:TRINITY_DN7700_c0_g6_i1.p1 TRINITY_DN7700_c0_g6~~TRINITY_DN7700_c0_g6_i1.p1  ORF type:complete len:173 (-),score=27.30 TRINITY_DN7700_c0_g6_i1:149-667(-)
MPNSSNKLRLLVDGVDEEKSKRHFVEKMERVNKLRKETERLEKECKELQEKYSIEKQKKEMIEVKLRKMREENERREEYRALKNIKMKVRLSHVPQFRSITAIDSYSSEELHEQTKKELSYIEGDINFLLESLKQGRNEAMKNSSKALQDLEQLKLSVGGLMAGERSNSKLP